MAIQPVHLEFHCSFAPDLSRFEELAAGTVRFHSERKVIEVERELAGDELACLRECHPELEPWQSLVDRIEGRMKLDIALFSKGGLRVLQAIRARD